MTRRCRSRLSRWTMSVSAAALHSRGTAPPSIAGSSATVGCRAPARPPARTPAPSSPAATPHWRTGTGCGPPRTPPQPYGQPCRTSCDSGGPDRGHQRLLLAAVQAWRGSCRKPVGRSCRLRLRTAGPRGADLPPQRPALSDHYCSPRCSSVWDPGSANRGPGVPVPELCEDTPHPSHSAVRGQ